MKNLVLTPSIESFQIKYAKTGQAVPVINDVHLHSIYYPIREADAFINKNLSFVGDKKHVLVLGLGYGYHINSLSKYLFNKHGDNYEICVVEPLLQLVADVSALSLVNQDKIKIFSERSIVDLFDNVDLVNFLIKRPAVLAYPASFNLCSKYFKAFLEYRASSESSEIHKRLCDESLKVFFTQTIDSANGDKTYSERINEKINLSKIDFLFLALDKITSESAKLLTE